jgi:hypothetical protein
VALALEVCSGFSAAVPVRAGYCTARALKLVGQVRVEVMISYSVIVHGLTLPNLERLIYPDRCHGKCSRPFHGPSRILLHVCAVLSLLTVTGSDVGIYLCFL